MSNPAPITNRIGAVPIPRELWGAPADELFCNGFNTFDIAAHFGITEAAALQIVTAQRADRLSIYRRGRLSA